MGIDSQESNVLMRLDINHKVSTLEQGVNGTTFDFTDEDWGPQGAEELALSLDRIVRLQPKGVTAIIFPEKELLEEHF